MIDSVHVLDRDVFMDLDKWFIIINNNIKMENVVQYNPMTLLYHVNI